jgi:hypothetical protein
MKLSRKSIGFGVAIIIGIALVLIHVPEVGERQENYTLNSGEITDSNAIGQTIVAQKNNLNGIGVLIATYSGRDNTHPVILHVRENVETTNDIRTVSVPASKFGDNQFYNFLFKAIPDSKNKTYFFLVDSPESVHGNAIAIDLNNKDAYQQGAAYIVHTADSKPITDSQLQRSGKQTVDTAFQTLYSVPLGTYLYDSARNAVHLFISTWQTNKQSYAVWTLSFLPSVACIALCIYVLLAQYFEHSTH